MAQIFRQAIHTLKTHPDVIPLWGACAYAGCLGLAVLGYTGWSKSDIIINKWAKRSPEERLDLTKPSQKILLTNSTQYIGYGERPKEVQQLYDVIYGNGDYHKK